MMKKWMATLCLFVMMATVLPVNVMAESPFFTDDIVLAPEAEEGVSRYVFLYTGVSDGWFHSNKVKLDIERGYINIIKERKGNTSRDLYTAYPAMEAKVWRWDVSQQQWVKEQNFDIYSDNEETIEFEAENAVYCLQLYFWNPDTVVKSYDKNKEFYMYTGIHKTGSAKFGEDVVGGYWSESGLPVVTVSAGDTVIFHDGNPTPFIPKDQ